MKLSRIAALCCLLAIAAVHAADDELAQRNAELKKVQSRIQSVQKTLDRDRGERDSESRALQTAERDIAEARSALRTTTARVEEQAAKVEDLRRREAAEQQRLAAQQQALGKQLRLAYEIGTTARTRVLLNQEDPALLSRVMTWFAYLNDARIDHIATLREQLQALAALRREVGEALAELHGLQQRQRERVDALDRLHGERRKALAALESRIRAQGRELSQLQADERQLRKLIESLRDLLADIPAQLPDSEPFSKLSGRLPWPTKGPLLARFGQPKAGGKLKWNGVWIAAGEGSAVRAVARGRVAYVGWMHRYGLIVVLEHGDGFYTLYGHNLSVDRSAGEWVRPGEVIAQAGSSGGQERPGLYFEVRKGADPVDPLKWLQAGG